MTSIHHSQRYKIISAVHLFLIKNGEVLLCRRFNTGYEDGKFSVAAGHIDEGETARQAMTREAKEELGVEVSVDDLEFAHIMHRHTDRVSADFFFFCTKWKGKPKITEPDKCDELQWVKTNDLPENTIPYI